jgi:hypothetical protein
VADMVAFCAGTRSSSAAARQCGYNHNRWRKTLTKTSVMMDAHVDGHGRSSNSLKRESTGGVEPQTFRPRL